MGSHAEPTKLPWLKTPCIRSTILSRKAGCNIFLKLETLQPSGSFKSRGIGNLMRRAIMTSKHPRNVHFYCSSGGNAGLACATAAIALQSPATIVVPLSTSKFMVDKLISLGADVLQRGAHWSEADAYLREELLAHDRDGVYVPPFDHCHIWEGNSTMIDELEEDLRDEGGYDALVCSVGGGGLLCGVMEGLQKYGRLDTREGCHAGRRVKVLAMETDGAHSLSLSLKENMLSTLPGITSIATSLGATRVASAAFQWAKKGCVVSCVFSDAEAAMASVSFADDERILVEAACGVSIAPAYNGSLHRKLFPELSSEEFSRINLVLIVCGGSNVSLEILKGYQKEYSMYKAT